MKKIFVNVILIILGLFSTIMSVEYVYNAFKTLYDLKKK